jgi:UDP-N-acetylmuramate--alanine ligase
MKLRDYKRVHCIGIGGIGLSAIARYCKSQGSVVSGSDGATSRVTDDLEKEGFIFYKGHSADNLSADVDLVIYTIAIKDTNHELAYARKNGIACMTYPEALGVLTKEYTTIAVCGTHGKTTTTAMIADMLKSCGKSPTVIVGSLLSNGGTNFIQGDSEYLIVEACEYKRSFLNLHPSHIVVTNIDEDHLDYYKDLQDIKSAFQEFVDKLPEIGSLVTHPDVLLSTKAKKVSTEDIEAEKIELSVLGVHNKKNASLALALALSLGLDEQFSRKGLKSFTGTWRRLEYKGIWHDIAMYDDYGHHPSEIQATLQALREKYSHEKYNLIVIFQPHLFSRTKLFLDDFAQSFSDANKICVLPIYAAREQDDESISSEDLVEIMPNAIFMESFEEIEKYVLSKPHYNTVLLTIGAGDVYYFHNGRKDVLE